MSHFAFIACQVGAERTIFQQLASPDGLWKKAFSRPGFITLKRDEAEDASPHSPVETSLPGCPYIRTTGWALGQLSGESPIELAEALCKKIGEGQSWDLIHFWHRDPTVPGWHGYEPGTHPETPAVVEAIGEAWIRNFPNQSSPPINAVATGGEKVLDVIAVEPNQWWIGYHVAGDRPSCWPGGVLPIHRPANMISRAYLKMTEALAWSRFPWQPGDQVVEIGSSPGGSCQRLLEIGMQVTGIDPAEMHEILLSNPNFTHWRGKAAQFKRKLFRKFRWLTADANVASSYTLDAVEAIVTYPGVSIEGMLLTLKMSEWSQASQLPIHLARIKSWGFPLISVRQLSYNRREVCVAASRPRSTKPRSLKKQSAGRRQSSKLRRRRHPSPRPQEVFPSIPPASEN